MKPGPWKWDRDHRVLRAADFSWVLSIEEGEQVSPWICGALDDLNAIEAVPRLVQALKECAEQCWSTDEVERAHAAEKAEALLRELGEL